MSGSRTLSDHPDRERIGQGKGKLKEGWFGSRGDMLGRFVDDEWGRSVVVNYANRFLGNLPSATKLVVHFGFGKNGDYMREAERVIPAASCADLFSAGVGPFALRRAGANREIVSFDYDFRRIRNVS